MLSLKQKVVGAVFGIGLSLLVARESNATVRCGDFDCISNNHCAESIQTGITAITVRGNNIPWKDEVIYEARVVSRTQKPAEKTAMRYAWEQFSYKDRWYSTNPSEGASSYQIKSGDTLSEIARREKNEKMTQTPRYLAFGRNLWGIKTNELEWRTAKNDEEAILGLIDEDGFFELHEEPDGELELKNPGEYHSLVKKLIQERKVTLATFERKTGKNKKIITDYLEQDLKDYVDNPIIMMQNRLRDVYEK